MHRSRASGASNLSRYGLFCVALWCTLFLLVNALERFIMAHGHLSPRCHISPMSTFKRLRLAADPIFGVRGLFLGSGTPPNGFGSSRYIDFAHRELLACHFCRNPAIFVISVISGDHGFCWSELECGAERAWGYHDGVPQGLCDMTFVLTRSTAEGVGGFFQHAGGGGGGGRVAD